MTSGTDDKGLRAQGRAGMAGPRGNVVMLTPKARIEMVSKRNVTKPPVRDQKAAPSGHDGDDDPGPSAA